jgi:hypothetical protein
MIATSVRLRLDELLTDRLFGCLTPEDEAELAVLLEENGLTLTSDEVVAIEQELEETLALVALSGAAEEPGALEALPATLVARLQAEAATFVTAPSAETNAETNADAEPAAKVDAPPAAKLVSVPRAGDEGEAADRAGSRPRWVAFVGVAGWAAAAAVALAWATRPAPEPITQIVTVSVSVPAKIPAPPSFAEQRAALLADGAKVTRVDWSATKDEAATGVTGDVVWDEAHDRGFMRFQGLAANDPQKLQYQLWIFDKEQDERHPIDGGVFDIDRKTGDVIVPIRAKIGVQTATLFAITIEKPGGVVVSSRKRLVLAAKVPAG